MVSQAMFDEFVELLAQEKEIKVKLANKREAIVLEAPPTGVIKATCGKVLRIAKQSRVDYSDKNLVAVLKKLELYDQVVKTAVDSTKLKKVRGDATLLDALKKATKENYMFSLVGDSEDAEKTVLEVLDCISVENESVAPNVTNVDEDWEIP